MLGAVCGDIAGSAYEFHPQKTDRDSFPLFVGESRFTDDSVLTFAIADALTRPRASDDELKEMIVDNFHSFVRQYPRCGYGGRFVRWIKAGGREPYNSFGNGSAMRVSPVAWAFETLEDVEKFAKLSAEVTHNHPEGIKGAQATAAATFLARKGASKEEIKRYIERTYNYDLNRTLAEIQPEYTFDVTCQGSVPEAIIAFLESESYEDAIRKAIWLGGDADTQAAIAGAIAEAFYGIPEELRAKTLSALPPRLINIYENWEQFLARKNQNRADRKDG